MNGSSCLLYPFSIMKTVVCKMARGKVQPWACDIWKQISCNDLHLESVIYYQWRNRRGQSAQAETSDREIFADVSGKKRKGKNGKGVKIEKKRRKIVKGKVENWIGSRKSCKKRWGPFFFFFFFFFLLFKTTEIWVYQNRNFLPGKSISRGEKNQEKLLCPLRRICLLRPCLLFKSNKLCNCCGLLRLFKITQHRQHRQNPSSRMKHFK